MKKAITTLSTFLALVVQAQNIEVLTQDDTVTVNSQTAEVTKKILFMNNTNTTRQIAVYEQPIMELVGTDDTVGYFASWSPLPGEPEHLSIEPYDTAFAFYVYHPNGQTGTHQVEICFYDYQTPADTICTTFTVITDQYVTITENTDKMRIFPNPTSSTFIIAYSPHKEWALFNIYGSLVMTNTVSTYHERVDISHLQPGVYFLNLVDDNHKVTTKKIVKK